MHKIIFFRKPEKIQGFYRKIKVGLGNPKHRYIFIWPYQSTSADNKSDIICRKWRENIYTYLEAA